MKARQYTFALILGSLMGTAMVGRGHNLDTTATSISFANDFTTTMSQRAALNQPLVAVNDEFWVLLKTTPGPGTNTGVGGYQTFYVPDGIQVIEAAYVFPDATDPRGFRNIPMKGQSPMAIGNGSVVSASSPELIGFDLPGVNGLGFDTSPVNASGLHRGTLAGVYADTGIFYTTDPRLGFNSYGVPVPPLTGAPLALKNNSGDTVGEYFAANVPNAAARRVLGVMTLWDSYQLRAYGRLDVAPLLDSNGRGTAPWGLANVVAGPQSGYAWEFDAAAYDSTSGTIAQKIQAAIKIGPWNRVKYPGSQIAQDQPGLVSNVLGHVGIDASQIGISPTAIPPDTKAVRMAIGQLELGRPEYSAVKVRVTTAPGSGDCNIMNADAFGGDAGGTDGGKDHIWRYFDPTVVSLNPCTFLQKVVSKALVAPGETFYYDITFANTGTVALPDFSLTDVLPAGLTHVSATPAQNTISGQTLTWNFGTVEPGDFINIRHYVKATGSGTLFNSVTAQSGINPVGVAQTSVEIGVRAILDKSKTVTPSAVVPGETVTYTLNIENQGTGNNGVPLRVREFLPAGFTYASLQAVTLNGATISSPTITVDSSNPSQPVFTVGQGIQPGRKLVINFTALVAASVQPGTFWNSFQLEYEGKIVPPIPEAPVTVAGGKIGDTVWRDWNGNGTQDPGEAGISGVTVQLYASDGTTLLGTTTTGANGNYFFPGLVAGTYVVKVTPPANTTLTGDPDGTLDSSHTISLANNQQYLTADFGYRPSGAGSIGDRVFEDVGNDGVHTAGADTGISGVGVQLYADANGDGTVTPGVDVLIGSTTTNGSGVYSFTGLAEGFNYLAVVNPADSALATYFGVIPFQASTANPQVVTNLSGSYLAADFGFWRAAPGSIGDQVFVDANGNGVYNPGTDSPLGGVTVTLLRDGLPVATTITAPDGTYLFDGLGPGSYTVSVNSSDPGIPAGHSPSTGQYAVSLTPGQNFLSADFPFTPLISKSVDKAYAVGSDALNYTVNVNYSGSNPLNDVVVRDYLPAGTSFTSAAQGGSLVAFSSTPGTPSTLPFGAYTPRVYALRGGATNTFWSHDTLNPGTWTTLATAPGTITTGAALTGDDVRYLYALQGGSRAFYRFDTVNQSWSDAAVADLPAGAPTVGDRGALVHLDGNVYALIGGSSQFWRYSISANSWTQMTGTPAAAAVGAGASLATDGENVYALRGASTQTVWLYNVAGDSWSTLASVGQIIVAGAGLAYADDGLLYATTGGNRLYRYDSAAGTWTQGITGGDPDVGGGLTTDGTTFYQLLGGATTTFVDRRFAGANVTLATAPGTVSDGAALTYLSTPTGFRTTSLSLSTATVAVGTPITVTMTVNSTQAETNVVPSALTVDGVSVTVSGPTPSSRNLTANTAATFTWTVTPTSAGILTVSGSAAGNGAAVFGLATSNSALASAAGGTQYVQWNLGSNTAAIPAATSTSNQFFALRGATTNAFWAYGIPQTAPGSWNSPLDPADVADAGNINIAAGGAMASDGLSFMYALQGNGTRVFARYSSVNNTWSNTAVADLPGTAPVPVAGAAAIYLNGSVYAWLGNASNQFWRYNVGTNTWIQVANTPATVLAGGCLATDGTHIYGLRGTATATFWRYTTTTDAWDVRATRGQAMAAYGAITHINGALYSVTSGKKRLYRYNISADTWTRLVDGPSNFAAGCAVATDGTDLYGLLGNVTGFVRHNVSANTWTSLGAAPANVGDGGSLRFQPAGLTTSGSVTASRSMVRNGNQVTVRLTATSDGNVGAVSAGTPTSTITGGAGASFSSATLISPDNLISGTGDPVIYEWTATVTASSATIGSIAFNTPYTVGANSATPRTSTLIVVPALTYVAAVQSSPPNTIRNTAQVDEAGTTINSVSSNTTLTATSATIGDFVWADTDADGVQDAGEYGIAGITVRLYAADGITLLQTTTTDSNGAYRFFGVAPGTYNVNYDASSVPGGYYGSTAASVPVTLGAGQQFNTADFGFYPVPAGTGSIGDYVWLDEDNDGVQDLGEAALDNVTVALERLINGIWVPIASDVTDNSGAYSFAGLSAADYRVTVDTDSPITSPYAQGTFALGDVMAPTHDRDGTGSPHVALVTLATNSTVVTNADFGYNWSGSIGDKVWWDYNRDGLQNEVPLVGVPNARVELYFDKDFDGVFDRILGDFEILRVFTDANGNYSIPNLPPGNYFVNVYEDSITTTGMRDVVPTTDDIVPVNLVPANMNPTTADFGYYQGARVEATLFWDKNHNGIREAGPLLANVTVTLTGTDNFGAPITATADTDASGNVFFIVPEGNYTISYATGDITTNYPALGTATTPQSFVFTAVAGMDGIRRFDFGVDNTGTIGDTIFADIDGNGSKSGSEPGLAGVTVSLYLDLNGNGVIDFGAGDLLLETTLTDANGNYSFGGLEDTAGASEYLVEVLTTTVPAAYQSVPSAYPVGADTANSRYGTALAGGQVINLVDFGYPLVPDVYHTVSGTIYHDNGAGGGTASDGAKNGAEPGLGTVTVSVEVDADGDGNYDQTYSILTDANGFYSLGGIPEGTDVRITVTEPTLPSNAYEQTGDPNGGVLSNVWLVADVMTNVAGIDFGYLENLGSIAGTVVVGGGNGIADTGELKLSGVPVTLAGAGADGIPGTSDDVTATTTTDGNGAYSFTGLLPGTYEVVTDIPSQYLELADRDGFNPNSINVNLGLGQNITGRDFEYQASTLAGVVRTDTNGNGLFDSGEPPIPGVTVFLDLDGDGQQDPGEPTATTDVNGAYDFGPLKAATYQVRVDPASLPAGSLGRYDLDGVGSLHLATVVLGINQDFTGVDFGYFLPAVIGDFVWNDLDANGQQDSGEPGIDGLVVNLFRPGFGPDGIAGNTDDADLVATTTTAGGGAYSIGGLPPGGYTLEFGPVSGFAHSLANTGADATDSDADAGTGLTGTITLAAGSTNNSVDAGYYQPGTITGHLYVDTNGNGIQDSGEPDLVGVDVGITDINGADQTVTTDSFGNWTASVPPGLTTVDVDETDPQYPTDSTQTEGTDSSTVVAVSGASTDAGIDGYFLPGSITGRVLKDTNNDDVGDDPMAMVVLTLKDGSGNDIDSDGNAGNGVQPTTTMTNASGVYTFGNLPVGNYRVVQSQPSGFGSVSDTDGANNNVIGDGTPIVVTAGNNTPGNDFVEEELGSISGFVLVDTTGDGNGDTALPGVLMTLLDGNGIPFDGDPVTGGVQTITTTTGSNGSYTFNGLAPGSYGVGETQPGGYLSVSDVDGGDPDRIGNTAAIVLAAGGQITGRNFIEEPLGCPNTWGDWVAEWTTALGGQTDPTLNPDGDLYSNLIEYAFCLPPDAGIMSPFCLELSLSVSGALDGVFHRTAGGALDVTYELQYISNLALAPAWTTVALNPANVAVTDNLDGTETVRIIDLETVTGLNTGTGFVRLKVSLDADNNMTPEVVDYTDTGGWVDTGLGLHCQSYNDPFLSCPPFSGTIDGVSGQVVDLTTSANGTNLSSLISGAHYLEVVSGDLAGHRFDITASGVDSITLALDNDLCGEAGPHNTIAGALPAALAGDTVVVRMHRTLGGLFPTTSFTPHPSMTDSDKIQFLIDGVWKNYWLFDDGGDGRWVLSGDATMTDQGGLIVPPGRGMFVNCRQTALTLGAVGMVRENDFARPLCGAPELVAGGYPVVQSANSRAMTLANGFGGSLNPKAANQFFVWRGDASPGFNAYDSYFLLDGGTAHPTFNYWAKQGDAMLQNRSAELLLLGNRSILINLQSVPLPGYVTPIPWTP